MPSLYTLDKDWIQSINDFNNCFDPTTGELIEGVDYEQAEKSMNELENARGEKIDNVLKYRANLMASYTGIMEEATRLINLANSEKKQAEKMEKYLEFILSKEGKEDTHHYGTWKMKWNKGTSTVIIDSAAIPEEFKKTTTTVSDDKTAIKEALKSGIIVPGAELQNTYSFSIK